jgi:hypothetical protein
MEPEENLLIIRILGTTGHTVCDIAKLLEALNRVHKEVTLLDGLVSLGEKDPKLASSLIHRAVESGPQLAPADDSMILGLMRPLVFHGANFSSPGSWDFLGKLNPLEVLREFLNDVHRRRQDREYRENAERRKLELENYLLESKVIAERIQILLQIGLSDDELRLLRRRLVPALVELEAAVDKRIIGSAEVFPVHVIELYRKGGEVFAVPADEAAAVETNQLEERQERVAG